MYIDRVLYPVRALGPGERLVIWVSGCSRRCRGCANPELWERKEFQRISPQQFVRYVRINIGNSIEGITVTGGEPFDQARDLALVLESLGQGKEVLVFTGYSYEELRSREEAGKLLALTDVLIDGPYVETLNDNYSALRGSTNQRIHYLNPAAEAVYKPYLREGRKIQNYVYDYKTLSVGIHNRNSMT